MVNLEEILESEKKPYQIPSMKIKYLNWQDIVTASGDDKDPKEYEGPDIDNGDL